MKNENRLKKTLEILKICFLNNIIVSDTEGSLIPFEEGGCTLLECDDFDNDDICDFEDDCPFEGEFGGSDGDWDDDEVCDSEDNCPETYNPNQEDFNNDQIGDACDGIGIEEELRNKKIIKTFDILGREINRNQTRIIILNIYEDGSVSQQYMIK